MPSDETTQQLVFMRILSNESLVEYEALADLAYEGQLTVGKLPPFLAHEFMGSAARRNVTLRADQPVVAQMKRYGHCEIAANGSPIPGSTGTERWAFRCRVEVRP